MQLFLGIEALVNISNFRGYLPKRASASVGKCRRLVWHRQQPNNLLPQPPPLSATPTHQRHVTTVAHGDHRPQRSSTANSHHRHRCLLNANNDRGTHAMSQTERGAHGNDDACDHHQAGYPPQQQTWPRMRQRHVTDEPSPPRSAHHHHSRQTATSTPPPSTSALHRRPRMTTTHNA